MNDFVKGVLTLEHMADHPLKVIPPKFLEVGKRIKVRVFNIDRRLVTFTKKDTLMKEKTPVYENVSEVKQGSKLVGVVVGEAEHGYVVRSFGGLKGLLTHSDIKSNSSLLKGSGELKSGSVVKTYILFIKKESGLALTLNKKTARKGKSDGEESSSQSLLETYFP